MNSGWLATFVGLLAIQGGACTADDGAAVDAGMNSGGGGSGGTMSAGGEGGGPIGDACPPFPSDHEILGCVSPAPIVEGSAELPGLTVARRIPPSASYCEAPGASYVATRLADALALDAVQAFELEDESGDIRIVQLAVGGAREDLLPVGETVTLELRAPLSPMSVQEGYLGATIDGGPLAFVSRLFTPSFAAIPDLGVVLGEYECGPECPGQERLLRVTANAEVASLPVGEDVALGGLIFQKAFATTRALPECGCTRHCLVDFVFGAYRAP